MSERTAKAKRKLEQPKSPGVNRSNFGSTRRHYRARVIDRRYTATGMQAVYKDLQGETHYKKIDHVVMDHTHEREKPDPSQTNHDRMLQRAANRKALKDQEKDKREVTT